MNKDYLDMIVREQYEYDLRVEDRLNRRYAGLPKRLFAKAEAMQNEVAEIKKELKPWWNWWRGNAGTELETIPELSEEQKQHLIEEGIDVMKFLLSYLRELGLVNAGQIYIEYMKKHKIIHDRLESEG